MQCSLCGYEFDETQMSCHASCAFNPQCAIICCPNCGYQVADENKSRLVKSLRRLLARGANVATGVCRLSVLQPGQSGRVMSIESLHHARVEKLNVLGVVPDATIVLEQKHPAFVLKVGFTELSIEAEIAEDIIVRVGG